MCTASTYRDCYQYNIIHVAAQSGGPNPSREEEGSGVLIIMVLCNNVFDYG